MGERLVSVILPVYNRENTIIRAIDSVLAQTYTNIELIVIDDSSTDNTVNVVKSFEDDRINLICLRGHSGANKARNIGIVEAQGAYLAFQDSDDEWLIDKLDTQIKMMENGEYLACYSAYNLYDGNFIRIIPNDFENQYKYGTDINKVLAEYNVVGTPTLVIKREVLTLLENEYFDEQMPRMQDYEFAIRLSKVCKLAYVNRPLINAYRTNNSISKDSSAMYISVGRIIKKHRDFLNMEKFMDAIMEGEAGIDNPQKLIDDLNILQEKTGLQDIGCKDRMLIHALKNLNYQHELLFRQYQWVVDHLQDKKFLIYGAGQIGCEVYRSLQKRGLCPAYFLVTKCEEKKFIDNIPIISIDECPSREDMVIISISVEHQIELMENLIARNYRQFCIYHKGLV